MAEKQDDALKPLAGVDGEPVFDEAWQAEALAIADTLVQQGLFTATAWSDALGAALRRAESAGATDNQQTYYECVVTALEGLIADNSAIDASELERTRDDWKQAYLSTPHGQPVRLPRDRED